MADGAGIILNDEDKRGYEVLEKEDVEYMFKECLDIVPHLEIVVFNACYSEPHAIAVSKRIHNCLVLETVECCY